MTYVKEAGLSAAARRRRRRTAITMASLAGFLLVSLLVALAFNQKWIGGEGSNTVTANPSCTPSKLPGVKDVTVNVYNATNRDGLAKKAGSALSAEGFRVAAVSNDPLNQQVPGVALIRHGASGAEEAQVVALRVAGAKLVKDTRADASVDLVLGDKFTAIGKPKPVPGQC